VEKYAKIRQKAFSDELEKLGIAAAIAGFLTKSAPKLLSFAGKNGKGVLSTAGRFLNRAGEQGLTLKQIFSQGIEGAAKKWGTKTIDFTKTKINLKGAPGLESAPTARPGIGGFSWGQSRKAVATVNPGKFDHIKFTENPLEWFKSRPAKWTGEAAENIRFIKDNGIGKFVQNSWKEGMTFKRNGFRYARTPGGKLASPLLSTGVGMGGLSFATGGTNPLTGEKVGLVKRTGKAMGEAAAWSIAPGFAMASITPGLVHDAGKFTKSLISQ
jgi:hypothetical protein